MQEDTELPSRIQQGEIEAYRAFQVVRTGPLGLYLYSTGQSNFRYDGPVSTNPTPPPDGETFDKNSGFYAVNTLGDVFSQHLGIRPGSVVPSKDLLFTTLYEISYTAAGKPISIGRVGLFGEVVRHEYGYRAQKIVIRELWAPINPDAADIIAERYRLSRDKIHTPDDPENYYLDIDVNLEKAKQKGRDLFRAAERRGHLIKHPVGKHGVSPDGDNVDTICEYCGGPFWIRHDTDNGTAQAHGLSFTCPGAKIKKAFSESESWGHKFPTSEYGIVSPSPDNRRFSKSCKHCGGTLRAYMGDYDIKVEREGLRGVCEVAEAQNKLNSAIKKGRENNHHNHVWGNAGLEDTVCGKCGALATVASDIETRQIIEIVPEFACPVETVRKDARDKGHRIGHGDACHYCDGKIKTGRRDDGVRVVTENNLDTPCRVREALEDAIEEYTTYLDRLGHEHSVGRLSYSEPLADGSCRLCGGAFSVEYIDGEITKEKASRCSFDPKNCARDWLKYLQGRIRSWEDAHTLFEVKQGGKPDRHKIGHETYLEKRGSGSLLAYAIRYHNTDVVRYYPDGSIELRANGWYTMNTRKRMNRHTPDGIRVWSDGECQGAPRMFVSHPLADRLDLSGPASYRKFRNGMRIGPNGGMPSRDNPVGEESTEIKTSGTVGSRGYHF